MRETLDLEQQDSEQKMAICARDDCLAQVKVHHEAAGNARDIVDAIRRLVE